MGFFTSLLSKKRKVAQVASSVEFNNSDCKCIQQELDISEIKWMDTSAYKNAKEMLRKQSAKTINTQINSKRQRDLFGF